MGIVNVTPDSFSGDGLGTDVQAAIDQGLRMVHEGADMLDVGGESTRPGHVPVKVISERLGHESPAFTLKQYAHVIPGMQAEAAAQVATMIDGASRSV